MTTDVLQHKGVESQLTHSLDRAFSEPSGGRRMHGLKGPRAALSGAAGRAVGPRTFVFWWDPNISLVATYKILPGAFNLFPAELML